MKNKFFIFFLFLFLSPSVCATSINTIEVQKIGNYEEIIIETSEWVKPSLITMEGKSIILDFEEVMLKENLKITTESVSISSIYGVKRGNGSRIIVNLKAPQEPLVTNIFGKNKIIVELPPPKIVERIIVERKPQEAKKKAEEIKAPKKIAKKITISPLKGKIIFIDPGHGGKDPGAIGRSGISEKQLNLTLALKLSRLLSKEGAKVVLSRKGNKYINMSEIVKAAKASNADIFISIHYNFSEYPNIGGTETYYYTAKSRLPAKIIHRSLLRGIRRRDRGVKKRPFYTIHHSQMPAILVEPAYISNPVEGRLSINPNFQYEVANDILIGLKEYFKIKK